MSYPPEMRATLPGTFLLVLVVIAGCGDDGDIVDSGAAGSDTGLDASMDADADTGADASADGGADAGPPPPPFCAPCRRDTDCAEGALCLVLADGERACGVPCTSTSDCASLAARAECVEEVPGLGTQCRPVRDTCVTVPPGTECASDADCGGRYDRCIDSEGLGLQCTGSCTVDADCPVGARRCRDVGDLGRVCVVDEIPSPERCQLLIDAGGATSCTSDTECASALCLMAGSVGVCATPAPCVAGPEVAPGLCAPSAPSEGPAAAVLADCACYAARDEGSLFDEAIDALGRTRCDLAWPSAVMNRILPEITHDPFRLHFTDRIQGDWSSAVPFAERVDRDLDGSGVGEMIAKAGAWADLGELSTEPHVGDDLVEALAALLEATGATPDRATLEVAAAGLSSDLQARLAPIVVALMEAHVAREAAVAILGDDLDQFYDGPSGIFLGGGLTGLDLRRSDLVGALLGDVDVARMAEAAARLAATIEAADLGSVSPDAGELTVVTPIGRIGVRGGDDHVYDADGPLGDVLLLVDLGGDDTYRNSAGATSGPDRGVSVVIDVRGADTYGYAEVPVPADIGPDGHARLPSDGGGRAASPPASLSRVSRQGVGRLGIGLLFDLGVAVDSYRSLRLSQGYGVLGVGVLFDEGGDDIYEAEAVAQGAGAFGIGLLIDRAGNDRYVAYRMAQGFAYARGFGALWDGAGDDSYLLHPSDVLYPSSQDRTRTNASLGQGAGFGRRADFTPDRVFMSGGLGVLRDVSGADQYRCGIFGQATGFWYGTGLLSDGAGNDRYDGQWYVQSGSAHFALSVFTEGAGNDVYNQDARRQNVTHGGGHDFSLAVFVERGGDDTYLAPGLSFGAGNAGGTGFFGDAAGTDSYDATRDISLGNASVETPGDALRRLAHTVGVFLDADGVDTYARPEVMPVANDALWRQSAHGPEENEEGVGVDRTGARLGF